MYIKGSNKNFQGKQKNIKRYLSTWAHTKSKRSQPKRASRPKQNKTKTKNVGQQSALGFLVPQTNSGDESRLSSRGPKDPTGSENGFGVSNLCPAW